MKAVITLCLVIIGCDSSKTTVDKKKATLEIQKFMDDYAVMLKTDIKNVGNLYYDSGAIISGFGNTNFLSLDTLKSQYSKRSNTEHFSWKDIRIDPLKEDLALVTSTFYLLNSDLIDSTKFAYTGLLVRTQNGWKIMHEHESRRPRIPATDKIQKQ